MTRQRWAWGLALGFAAREPGTVGKCGVEQELEGLRAVAVPEAVAPVSAPAEPGASDRLALEVAGLRSEMAALRRWVQEQSPAAEVGASAAFSPRPPVLA
jgi:hypothetical protein